MMSAPSVTWTVAGLPSLIRGGENTLLAELQLRREDLAADDFAEAPAFCRGELRRAIEEGAGFLGHPEDSLRKARADILGSASRVRELEIMDDGRAVGRDRADDAVAQHAADDRAQADFDRMRAAHQKERALPAMSDGHGPREFAQLRRT